MTTSYTIKFKALLSAILIICSVSLHAQPISGYERPGECNTGPTDESVLVSKSTMNITTEGAVIENVYVKGMINVKANNVTIRNFIIDGEDRVYFAIHVYNDATGLVIEDGEIRNFKAEAVAPHKNYTARRINVHDSEGDAFKANDNTVIESCWMHHLGMGEDAHADGVQVLSGSNIIIRGNYFDSPNPLPEGYSFNSAVILKTDGGKIDNVLIENNWMNGGGFTMFSRDGGSGCPTNVTIQNNHIGGSYVYGILSSSGCTENVTYQNNLEDPEGLCSIPDCGGTSSELVMATGVSLSVTSLSIAPGESSAIVATVAPSDATFKTVEWKSSNPDVAVVTPEGVVAALSPGTATITATTDEGAFTANCSVEVTATLQLMNLDDGKKFNTIPEITWPANVGDADVCLWNDDKVGALTLTIDDNIVGQHDWWLSMQDKYPSLKFSWFLIHGTGGFAVEWPKFQRLIDAGHEVQAHDYCLTLNHGAIRSQDDEAYHDHFETLNNIMSSNLTNQIATIAYPYGNDRNEAVRDLYIGMRGGVAFPNKANTINYLCVSSISGSDEVHHINTLIDPSVTVWNQVFYRGWTCAHYHQVSDLTSLETYLSYLHSKSDVIWNGCFSDVVRYGQERDTHTLTTIEAHSDSIRFVLSDDMNDTYFDFPLTVKVRVDDSWENVAAKQNGVDVDAKFVEYEGNKYALVKAVPDKGVVTLLPAPSTTQTKYITHTLPGIIEFENYDNGGQDISYNDDSHKSGDYSFRAKDKVDVEATSDSYGEYSVSWTNDGEWMEYTVDEIMSGIYKIDVRAAAENTEPGELVIKLGDAPNGTDFTTIATVDIQSTGDADTWQTFSVSDIYLEAAVNKVIRVEITGVAFDLNQMEFTATLIDVTDVSVEPEAISIFDGDSYELTATIAPDTASIKTVTWTSSNASVATVDTNGVVTAVAVGTATITATTQSGSYTASCVVTVAANPENLALNKPVNVDSKYNDSYIGSNAVDGSKEDANRWVSSDSSYPHWIEIDLEDECSIVKINFWTGYDGYYANVADYAFQYWDGTTWVDIISITGNDAGVVSNTFEAVTATKVRLYATKGIGNNILRLYELEVLGYNPGSGQEEDTDVTGVSLNKNTSTIDAGATEQLTATITPSDATNKSVGWSSSDVSIATVDANGLITGISAGTATITVTTNDGGYTATCVVTVNEVVVPVTGVELVTTFLNIYVGETSNLTATVIPTEASDNSITWTTSDAAIATVDVNGLVEAVASGTATITVTTIDGNYTATCAVTVAVPVISVTGISVSPSSITLNEGEKSELTLEISPADATDKLATWSSSDETIATVDENGNVTAKSVGKVTITATSNDGNYTASSDITVNTISGVAIVQQTKAVRIYPNPLSSDYINISISGFRIDNPLIVSITDISGKLMIERNVTATELLAGKIKLNKGSMHSGIYLLKVSDRQEMKVVKLVIK